LSGRPGQAPVWISGGTGLIGGRLREALWRRDLPARIVTRQPQRVALSAPHEVVGWDGLRPSAASLAGCRAVVHLSGEPVFGGLPTAARRERLGASRVASTRALVTALGEVPDAQRPGVLVCASAVGYYGDRGEQTLDESSEPGEGFLAELCRDWEGAADGARDHGLRVVQIRIGIVLSRRGGALAQMLPIYRAGLGGRIGSGEQWLPWIHLDDVVGVIERSIDDDALDGPVNATAPQPVRQCDFSNALAAALSRPAFLRVPAFALRVALGPLADELLGSRRVEPRRIARAGYAFVYPELPEALEAETTHGGG
jgi:hypothetical protein